VPAAGRSRTGAVPSSTTSGAGDFTVLQQTDGLPLQPIASDRFERAADGWRFTFREVSTDLVGDVSQHRRVPG
jgi:hypothetical protein